MSKLSTKIIHISDLHICDEEVAKEVEELFVKIKKIESSTKKLLKSKRNFFPETIKFERSNINDLRVLKNKIIELRPDAVIISGDITAFGDKKSFEVAKQYINEIASTGIKILCTPGNHDVLSSYWLNLAYKLKNLISELGSLKKLFFKVFFNNNLNEIESFIGEIIKLCESENVQADKNNGLKNYNRLFNLNDGETYASENLSLKCCNIYSYDTVSKDPIFMNLGVTSISENLIQANKKHISVFSNKNVNILFFHHNPISSPSVKDDPLSFAYNSMPSSSSFLQNQQTKGMNIMLYGHQHKKATIQMDYLTDTPGHFYLVGGASATIGENCGFYKIVIYDRYLGKLKHYNKNSQGDFYESKKEETILYFECQGMRDKLTLQTQKEIRKSKFEKGVGDVFWQKIFDDEVANFKENDSSKIFYFVGPRQNDLKGQVKLLENIINSGNEVRILINNNHFYSDLKSIDSNKTEKLKHLLGKGKDITWELLEFEINELLTILKEFYLKLSDKQKSKFNIRLSHTLLPIGARTVQNSETDFILLRLLPQGIDKNVFPKIGTIFLNKRSNEALYIYYFEYIEKLWEAGETYEMT
jgi:DNA repair exonuclease SbcCD nuclease subunit